MKQALRVFWQALKDANDELLTLALMNAVTVLLLVPLVTGPPALAALWAAANRVARGGKAEWPDYWRAFRELFGRAWMLAALQWFVTLTLLSNLVFYTPGNNPLHLAPDVLALIRAAWLGVFFVWLLVSQHFLPLMMEQEDRRLRTVVRNALLLVGKEPLFSVVLLVLIVLLGAVSTLLTVPCFFFTVAFVAVLGNEAVHHLLAPFRDQEAPAQSRDRDGG